MNVYQLVVMLVLILVLAEVFGLGPAVQKIADRVADIELFQDRGENPALIDLAILYGIIIAIVGIARMYFQGKKNDTPRIPEERE